MCERLKTSMSTSIDMAGVEYIYPHKRKVKTAPAPTAAKTAMAEMAWRLAASTFCGVRQSGDRVSKRFDEMV